MADIIIADAEFAAEHQRALQDAQNAESLLENICAILANARDSSLLSGNIAENFKSYVELVSAVRGQLVDAITEEQSVIKTFIDAIDSADSFLYGE